MLRGAPTARLLLKYSYFEDPVLRRATQARFAARGVAPEQLVFDGHSSGQAYYDTFRRIDLMLDAWPAGGSTTTLEALSNGVPVLMMAEPSFAGLYTRNILEVSGLGELVTASPEAFVATRAGAGRRPAAAGRAAPPRAARLRAPARSVTRPASRAASRPRSARCSTPGGKAGRKGRRMKLAFFGYAWNKALQPDAYMSETIASLAGTGADVDVYLGNQLTKEYGIYGLNEALQPGRIGAFVAASGL